MQSDSVTRVLLAFIVVCLLLLLAQGAGSGGTEGTAPSSTEGRFKVFVQPMKGGALLVKADTATGSVWRKSLTGDGPWVLVDEESRTEPDL